MWAPKRHAPDRCLSQSVGYYWLGSRANTTDKLRDYTLSSFSNEYLTNELHWLQMVTEMAAGGSTSSLITHIATF